jgi:hypothetical protein
MNKAMELYNVTNVGGLAPNPGCAIGTAISRWQIIGDGCLKNPTDSPTKTDQIASIKLASFPSARELFRASILATSAKYSHALAS